MTMNDAKEIDVLIGQLKETIERYDRGTLSPERTGHVYRTLRSRYESLEKRHVSDRPGGFIKGILHHHTRSNHSSLTAVLVMNAGEPETLAFSGDAILLKAIPELISGVGPSLDPGTTVRLPLGEKSGSTHSLYLARLDLDDDTTFFAAVTGTPLFDTSAFEHVAGLMTAIFEKYCEYRNPATLDYIHYISSECTRMYCASGGSLIADHFILNNPLTALSLTGTRQLIDFSEFMVETLLAAYPEPVTVLVVSLASYLVLFDDSASTNAEVRHGRIDIVYHTNIVPYRSTRTTIDSPGSLALFIEGL